MLKLCFFVLLSFVCSTGNSGAMPYAVEDVDGISKLTLEGAQVAVCSGSYAAELLNCKFNDGGDIVRRSIYSLSAMGWRLQNVAFDAEKKIAYFYLILNDGQKK